MVEYLSYEFTDLELKELGLGMAHATNQASAVEEKKKAVNAGFKDDIEGFQLVARKAARSIQNGSEMRDIKCTKTIDYKKGEVCIVRKDTGEEIRVRDIQDHERQMTIVK